MSVGDLQQPREHDPKHAWTAEHHHPWNGVDRRYVVWESWHLEHVHDGANAMRQREPT